MRGCIWLGALVSAAAIGAMPTSAATFAPAPTVHVKATSTRGGLTRLSKLNVGPLKPGSTVRLVCQSPPNVAAGTGCPFHAKNLSIGHHTARLPLLRYLKGRALAPGTKIAVEADHVFVVATNVLIVTRAHKPPLVEKRCGYPYPCPAPREPY